MKVKDLVMTGKGFQRVIIHSQNGFKFEGEWETPAIKYFDMWEKANNKVESWEIVKKILYIVIK